MRNALEASIKNMTDWFGCCKYERWQTHNVCHWYIEQPFVLQTSQKIALSLSSSEEKLNGLTALERMGKGAWISIY